VNKKLISSTVTGLPTACLITAAVAFSFREALAQTALSATNIQVNQVFAGPSPMNKQNESGLAQNPTKFTTGGDQTLFSRSTDGGATWRSPLAISPSYNNNAVGGRQGSAVKVGPDGIVYVVWLDTVDQQAVEPMSISHVGGKPFLKPDVITQCPTTLGNTDIFLGIVS
jgi:hypothetical protein